MKFTIATPVFNGLPWLPLCIASIQDQLEATEDLGFRIPDSESRGAPLNPESRIPNPAPPIRHSPFSIEHLVQDGGSTDSEWQLVGNDWRITAKDGFRTTDSGFSIPAENRSYRLSYVREPDAGMYDAINRAWRRGAGDIIAYLNADEQYLPGTLNRVALEFATKPHLDIVFGDALLINAEGRPLSYRRVVPPSRAHTQVVHLGTLSCAMFFRRKLLDDGFFFDTRWRAIGDAEWVWRVLGSGVRVGIIDEPLAAFTMTGANLGENPKALAEADQWRSEAPTIQQVLAPVFRIRHWVQKAIAGAYRCHHVRSAVFTTSSPTERTPFDIPNLGSSWRSA